MLSVFTHPCDAAGSAGPFVEACAQLVRERAVVAANPAGADLAIAPLLRRRIAPREVSAPLLGTLIFHPSLLPRRRGPDAVRWAVMSGDTWGGVSWFWADEGLDTGPICEQEVVALDPGASPGRNYHERLAPAGLRCLERALDALTRGHVRRVAQDERAATYESWWKPLAGSERFA